MPDTWEYKFSATQEIPVIRFPSPFELSVNPNPSPSSKPGSSVGFYFNEVLSLHGDLKADVPACGAMSASMAAWRSCPSRSAPRASMRWARRT